MQNRTLNIIIISGVFSILLLFVVQFFWAQNLVRLEEKQFNHKVKMGLLNAGYKLKLIHHSKIDKIHLVKQLNENSYVVEINDFVNPTTIDSLLQIEFSVLELNAPYKIAIYDCFTDSVIYSHSGSNSENYVAAEEYGVDWDINSYNFGVIFSERSTLSNYLNIGLASGIVIVGVVAFFVYVILMFLRQKKLNDIKTDFINNMTHELKTPISTIALSSSVIKDPEILKQPERLKRYAEIIHQENDRLKNQVERVLQLAFFEKSDFELAYKKCSMQDLLSRSKQPFELLLQEKNGACDIQGSDFEIEVDEHHFINAITNLIDNGIKYAGVPAPTIKINVKQDAKVARISIADNGIGMDKDEIKNIFKKFYRAPTGNIHNVKGFGIGLSYVEQIITMHGGKINVTSKKNKGTIFELVVPLKQKQ